MKRFLASVLAIFLIAATGCGAAAPATSDSAGSSTAPAPSSGSAASTPSSSSQPVTISWWGTPAVHEFTLELCDKYTEKTGVPLEAIYASWGDYWQKMNTLAAAGDLPDIMRQDYAVIQQYASKGLLEPLDDYIASGAIDMSKVDPMLIEGGRVNGKLYGINVGSNALCLMYDKEMIADAGLQPPSPTTTWADFEKFCSDYKAKTGLYGVGLKNFVENMSIFEIYARGFGETLYTTADGKPALGFKEETLVSFFEMLKRMHDAGSIPKIDTTTQETSGEDSLFAKGQAVSDILYTDMYASFVGVKGKQLGMTIIPGSGATKSMYSKPSQFLSIASTSNRKDDAVKFIDLWINDSDVNRILNGRRGVPISSAMAEQVSAALDETGKATFAYMNTVGQYSRPIDPPSPSGASEVASEFKKQMEMVLFGESTPAAAAASFINDATVCLNTANK